MIEIANVIPTQNRIRDPDKVKKYIRKFEKGLVLRTNKRKIKIFKIEESQLVNAREVYSYYCHDGHHRMLAAERAGVTHLYPGEYIMEDMTYEMMNSINLDVGWSTPFDPRSHVRIPDLTTWKTFLADELKRFVQEGLEDFDSYAYENIIRNPQEYRETREVISFRDMEL